MEQATSTIELPDCDRRFRSAFVHAAIGVAIVDTTGAYVFANREFCRISGYEEHELRELKFTATLHLDDRDSRLKLFHQLVAGEIGSYVSERRFIRKDSQVVWVRLSITLPDDDARPSQIIVFAEDITERKETENALRASEERFRIAAENASDMIYEWDLRTGAVGVFGANHQRLGDWPVPLSYEDWKSMVHPRDLERMLPQFARFIQPSVFAASRSNAATASSRCSSRVSSILLWLMPPSDCTNSITVGTPSRATSAASCSGPEGIR